MRDKMITGINIPLSRTCWGRTWKAWTTWASVAFGLGCVLVASFNKHAEAADAEVRWWHVRPISQKIAGRAELDFGAVAGGSESPDTKWSAGVSDVYVSSREYHGIRTDSSGVDQSKSGFPALRQIIQDLDAITYGPGGNGIVYVVIANGGGKKVIYLLTESAETWSLDKKVEKEVNVQTGYRAEYYYRGQNEAANEAVSLASWEGCEQKVRITNVCMKDEKRDADEPGYLGNGRVPSALQEVPEVFAREKHETFSNPLQRAADKPPETQKPVDQIVISIEAARKLGRRIAETFGPGGGVGPKPN